MNSFKPRSQVVLEAMLYTDAGQSQQVPRTEVVRPQNTTQETPSTPMPRRSGRILTCSNRRKDKGIHIQMRS